MIPPLMTGIEPLGEISKFNAQNSGEDQNPPPKLRDFQVDSRAAAEWRICRLRVEISLNFGVRSLKITPQLAGNNALHGHGQMAAILVS
jgi:hypothetical protein